MITEESETELDGAGKTARGLRAGVFARCGQWWSPLVRCAGERRQIKRERLGRVRGGEFTVGPRELRSLCNRQGKVCAAAVGVLGEMQVDLLVVAIGVGVFGMLRGWRSVMGLGVAETDGDAPGRTTDRATRASEDDVEPNKGGQQDSKVANHDQSVSAG